MKPNSLITAIICAICFSASAQTEKGTTFGGGSFGFGTSNKNSTSIRLNSLSIGPRVGYFFTNGFAAGMEISYQLSNLDGEFYTYFNENTQLLERGFGFKEENFTLAPFTRYYFKVNKTIRVFGQANLIAELNSYKNIDENDYLYRTDFKFRGFGASISPGLNFFPSEKWAIEFSFPVVRYYTDRAMSFRRDEYLNPSRNFRFVLENFSPSFGINFNIK